MASIYSDVVPVVEVALSCKLPSYGIISSDSSLENEVQVFGIILSSWLCSLS